MPKTDGWAVLGTLKGDPELCHIPVIMVTVAPDRSIGLSLGAADVMTKPVDRAALAGRLRQLVSRDGPILVVEDDEATRLTVRHTIEKMGLAAVEAINGRLALDWMARNRPPALILLDLMMPEMDGFEFLERVQVREEWRHVPVVVITAKQLSGIERSTLYSRARSIVEKRTSIDSDITTAISNAVGRRVTAATD
jgi:CheY-like chemotaxis protein